MIDLDIEQEIQARLRGALSVKKISAVLDETRLLDYLLLMITVLETLIDKNIYTTQRFSEYMNYFESKKSEVKQ